MRQVLEHLGVDDEAGLVRFGSQSNGRPWGDRDTEGYVECPELNLRPAGQDLTILLMAPAAITGPGAAALGTIGSESILNIAEELRIDDWIGGEVRLVCQDYSEPVTDTPHTLRRGSATVLRCSPSAAITVTFDIAANTVIMPAHGRRLHNQVQFTSTAGLPGNVTAGRVYLLRDVTTNTAKLCEYVGGPVVDLLAGASGTIAAKFAAHLTVKWVTEALPATLSSTYQIASPGTWTSVGHTLTPLSTVVHGTVPPEQTAGNTYFVAATPTANTWTESATAGGTAINFSAAGGPTTTVITSLANIAGYVHLNDRFTTYDNVLVTVPFQPIEPLQTATGYPADPPLVPGITLQPNITKHEDLGLALPFCWNEGIEGHGAVGTVQVVGLTANLQGGQTLPPGIFNGGFLRVGNSKGRVAIAGSDPTSLTVESWIGGQPPAVTNLPFHVHLGHYRNNAHHYAAGEGFLYPADDMQPGSNGVEGRITEGVIYSRPRARFAGAYVNKAPQLTVPVSAVINSALIAQAKTTAGGQFTAAIVGGNLRVSWTNTTHNPLNGNVPFERFLRPGQITIVGGLGQTPSVDGIYRVVAVQHTTAAAGSFIDLAPYDPTVTALPVAVAGVVPANASVTRSTWKPLHKFGSLIPAAWRIANAIGRRVVLTHLSVNSSSQVLRRENAGYGFQGRLGWWDDDLHFNWTPGDPNSLAGRAAKLIQTIAPAAIKHTLGTGKRLKQLLMDTWQGESEAIQSQAQRELAARTMPTFANWLSGLIVAAGQSPYAPGVKIPLQWAKITSKPWELPTLPPSTTSYSTNATGDPERFVNRAIVRTTATYGWGASVDPELHEKVSFDDAHFNGFGMGKNGREIARLGLQLIDLAFSSWLGPTVSGLPNKAIGIANEALRLIGESAVVRNLEPTPDATQQARDCALLLPTSRDYVLQRFPWTFARDRQPLVAIDNRVSTWAYCYAVPVNLLKPNLVLAADAPDEVQIRWIKYQSGLLRNVIAPNNGVEPATQPFKLETEDGIRVLRTNLPDAQCVFTCNNVDFGLWSPSVRAGLVMHLASQLVGSIAKGREGRVTATDLLRLMWTALQEAAADDYEFGTDVRVEVPVDWLPPQRRR